MSPVGRVLPLVAWSIIAGLASPGCGGGDDGIPREAISGSVTLDDRPLESGTIRFMPTDPSAAATGADATITAGRYSIPAAQGLSPGPYLVLISAVAPGESPSAKRRPSSAKPEESGTGAADAPVEPPTHESLPARYNTQSTLKAEVAKGRPNVFDFPLKSK